MSVTVMPKTRVVHPLVAGLTRLRETAGRTRGDVAQAAKTRTHRLTQWETGASYPTMAKLDRWAGALGERVVVRSRTAGILPGDLITALTGHRHRWGLSQEQLSYRFDEPVTQSQISDWELRRNIPGLWSITRWADALGCDLVLVPARAGAR